MEDGETTLKKKLIYKRHKQKHGSVDSHTFGSVGSSAPLSSKYCNTSVLATSSPHAICSGETPIFSTFYIDIYRNMYFIGHHFDIQKIYMNKWICCIDVCL